MTITIAPELAAQYPTLAIGYVAATVHVGRQHPHVEALKARLQPHVEALGITADNYTTHPAVAAWRRVYSQDFGVKPSAFRCSLEALLKRLVRNHEFPSVNTVVDLYNCCSILSLLPMGALDLDRVTGDITVRRAAAGEPFLPLGSPDTVHADPRHVVYADEATILTWLWNHRDSRATAIQDETRRAIFFVDAHAAPWSGGVAAAVADLADQLHHAGSRVTATGVLTAEQRVGQVD